LNYFHYAASTVKSANLISHTNRCNVKAKSDNPQSYSSQLNKALCGLKNSIIHNPHASQCASTRPKFPLAQIKCILKLSYLPLLFAYTLTNYWASQQDLNGVLIREHTSRKGYQVTTSWLIFSLYVMLKKVVCTYSNLAKICDNIGA